MYRKALHGPLIAETIGLDAIREECPRFNQWVECLESLSCGGSVPPAGPPASGRAMGRSYLDDLRRVRASGGATGERSSYGPLANLLNAVGATLKPKVFCVGELADQGAGHPDFGLYTAKQVQRGRPREGQAPERGVVEVKSPHEDLRARRCASRWRAIGDATAWCW